MQSAVILPFLGSPHCWLRLHLFTPEPVPLQERDTRVYLALLLARRCSGFLSVLLHRPKHDRVSSSTGVLSIEYCI